MWVVFFFYILALSSLVLSQTRGHKVGVGFSFLLTTVRVLNYHRENTSTLYFPRRLAPNCSDVALWGRGGECSLFNTRSEIRKKRDAGKIPKYPLKLSLVTQRTAVIRVSRIKYYDSGRMVQRRKYHGQEGGQSWNADGEWYVTRGYARMKNRVDEC